MPIRIVLAGLAAATLAACGPDRPRDRFDVESLNEDFAALAARVGAARLAAGVMDLGTAEVWANREAAALPMADAAALLIGAAALAESEAGRLSLDDVVTVLEEDLSPQPSAISRAWPARQTYTVRELLALTVRDGDNTAADVLMKQIGGPGAISAWLTQERLPGVRVDRYQREIRMEMAGLAPFRPAWKDAAPLAAVPEPQRRAALADYLADPRDTATVQGLLDVLARLESGELVSPGARRLLLTLMEQRATGPALSALPRGARLAHVTGAARPDLGVAPALNEVGVVTLPDGRRLAIVILLSGCRGEMAACEAVATDAARALLDGAG